MRDGNFESREAFIREVIQTNHLLDENINVGRLPDHPVLFGRIQVTATELASLIYKSFTLPDFRKTKEFL